MDNNTRDRQGRYKFNIEACSRNRSCREKAISITYSGSVFVPLGIQNAMRMRHIARRSLPALQYISALSHKRHDFRKKKIIEYKLCVLIFYKTLV